MKKPHVYELNLKALKEPDDLWNRLFLDWLKSISEQHAMTTDRLNALERAIAQLDRAIGELLPEKPQDLSNAMTAHWAHVSETGSSRSCGFPADRWRSVCENVFTRAPFALNVMRAEARALLDVPLIRIWDSVLHMFVFGLWTNARRGLA